jgi:serine/threonine protein kinase
MEYVSGGDLKQRLANGALPPQQALEILRQVASALGYAHQQGFVHRDVKPENILFRADGAAVLTDFGIAKAVGAGTRMTATGMTIGTSHYMSPEQARGQEVDGRSDLYSLGVVFYEMLTANVPYQAADSFAVALKHINDPVPQLPSELAVYQPLLDRMLAKEPIDRYQDLPSMLAELKNEASESNGAGIKVIRSGTELMPEIAKPPQKRSPWEPAPKPKKPKREPSPSDSYWVGYLTLTILLAGIIALLILPNI